MPGLRRRFLQVTAGVQHPSDWLSAPGQTLRRWARRRSGAVWMACGALVRFPDGRSFWARITDMAAAMCNGGLFIFAGAEVPAVSDRQRQASGDICTAVQIDGDIVVRLSPRLRDLPATKREALLDDHFAAVERALRPMKELQALIIAIALLARVSATAAIVWMEALPLIRVLADGGQPVWAFFDQVKIQSHLLAGGMLMAAILMPQLLRALVSTAARLKLGRIIAGPASAAGRN